MAMQINEYTFGAPCKNEHNFIWFLFCVILVVTTLGLAGIALILSRVQS